MYCTKWTCWSNWQCCKGAGCICIYGFNVCFLLLLCAQVLSKRYQILFAPKRHGLPTCTFRVLYWVKVSARNRTSVLAEQSIWKIITVDFYWRRKVPQSPKLRHKGLRLISHALLSLPCFAGSPRRQVEHPAVCGGNFHPGNLAPLRMSEGRTQVVS